MIRPVRPALTGFERNLLSIVRWLVPAYEREEWSRTWQAELWYMHQRSHHRHVSPRAGVIDLSIGLTRDALWLRTEKWRVGSSDTATLCLVSLLGLSLLSALVALALAGSWRSLDLYLRDEFTRSLIAAPHVALCASRYGPTAAHGAEQHLALLDQTTALLHAEDGTGPGAGLFTERGSMFAASRRRASHRRPAADVRLCLLRAARAALGDRRPGATLQALPALSHHARAGWSAFAQSAGVERHGTELQARAWAAQHPRDGNELVPFQPLDQPGRFSIER